MSQSHDGRRYNGHYMKGGVYVDEKNLSPNANWWKWGAQNAFDELVSLLGYDKADIATAFWSNKHTWKEVCEKTEILCNVVSADFPTHVGLSDNLELGRRAIVSGGEVLEI